MKTIKDIWNLIIYLLRNWRKVLDDHAKTCLRRLKTTSQPRCLICKRWVSGKMFDFKVCKACVEKNHPPAESYNKIDKGL